MAPFDPAIDSILFPEELTQEQQQVLKEALVNDPVLTGLFYQWRQIRTGVRNSLFERIPDSRLLVLFALDASGRVEGLTSTERQWLEEHRISIERALEAHPGLSVVIDQIGRECKLFDEVWAVHFDEGDTVATRTDREPLPRASARPSPMRRMWRTAALLTVVAFAAILLLVSRRDSGLLIVRTEPGQVQSIELADGSLVRLMGGSELAYADPAKDLVFDRRVRLDGRAFFDVVPGSQNFVVSTSTALATVLGTSFGVETGAEHTEVVLVTGRLSLAPSGAPGNVVVLEEGQMSRVAANAAPSTPVEIDPADALDWTGLFIFRNTSLEQITERLSRHYRIPITVADEMGDEPITGIFSPDQALDDILGTLSAAVGGEIQQNEAGAYLLTPAP